MSDAVISAAELRASPVPTVLDVRWTLGGPSGHADYLAGHVPGAAFMDLDEDLAAPPGRLGRHPLPDADAFGTAMRRVGVSAARPVVVYAGRVPGPAARAWWLLRYFGHPNVSVLDGGIDAWVAAGGSLETGAGTASLQGDFTPTTGGLPVLDATSAARLAKDGLLLDARTPERFRGESEPIDPVAGHIPGARNLPAGQTVQADGRLRDVGALQDALHALGATGAAGAAGAAGATGATGEAGATEIGAYCGSGVTAAHTVLALAHAGRPASLYVGSWSDWITDPDRPVARGE